VMERAILSATNLGLALVICVCLCGKTVCSKNTRNVTSAEAAIPVTGQEPAPAAPNDCRLPKDDIEGNASFIHDSPHHPIYALLSNNAYKREKQEQFRLPSQEWGHRDDFIPVGTETGLGLKVFEKVMGGKPVEVVVAFRGTDDLKDWWQNLSPQLLFPKKR